MENMHYRLASVVNLRTVTITAFGWMSSNDEREYAMKMHNGKTRWTNQAATVAYKTLIKLMENGDNAKMSHRKCAHQEEQSRIYQFYCESVW